MIQFWTSLVLQVYRIKLTSSGRRQRVSGRQVDMLWEFLNSHREIASSFNRSLQDKEYSQRRWRELADILNAQGDGALKDGKGWCKYWVDYKAKIKSRIAALRSSQRRTGEPSTEKPLTEIEEKFLQILGEDFGQGSPGVRVDAITEPQESDTAMVEVDVQGSESIHNLLSPFQFNLNPIEPNDATLEVLQIQKPSAPLLLPSQTPIRPPVGLSQSTPPRPQSPVRTPPLQSYPISPQPNPTLPSATPAADRSPRNRTPRRIAGRRRHEHPLSMEAARRALVRDSQMRAEAALRTSNAIEKIAETMQGMQNSLTRIERVEHRARASPRQFGILIEFMERHGDLTRPTTNSRGRIETMQRWEELATMLNSDASGDKRTTEKWKKVWSDYKNNTKRKAARISRAASGSSDGPAIHAKLNDLEVRALNLIAVQAPPGLAVDEAGFSQEVRVETNMGGPEPMQIPASSIAKSDTQKIDIEISCHPGPPSLKVLASEAFDFLSPVHASDGVIENADNVEPPLTATLPAQARVTLSPQLQPAHSGQTSTGRITHRSPRIPRRTRGLPHRIKRQRQSQTERAAQHFLQSDSKWREFKMQQHREYMEMRREQNRIREMEVQTQQQWQVVGLRALDLMERMVNHFCRN